MSGYTVKYSLSPREIPRAPPSGIPSCSGYISPYIPPLVIIQIQYDILLSVNEVPDQQAAEGDLLHVAGHAQLAGPHGPVEVATDQHRLAPDLFQGKLFLGSSPAL